MRPTEITKHALVWRFREIGIEIMFWRKEKRWGGLIDTGSGPRVLPMNTLSLLIEAHAMEQHV